MRIKRKTMILLSVFCLGFGATSGITNAYLSKRTDILNNVIRTGAIRIELKETSWDAVNASNLLPGTTVAKNPTVTNQGTQDSWIFLKVKVPIRTVSVLNEETRRKTEKTATELIRWQANTSWQFISRSSDAEYAEYVYAYTSCVKPGETTQALFENVTYANVIEGEMDGASSFLVPIEAVAIQKNVAEESQGLYQVYQEILKQKDANERSNGL